MRARRLILFRKKRAADYRVYSKRGKVVARDYQTVYEFGLIRLIEAQCNRAARYDVAEGVVAVSIIDVVGIRNYGIGVLLILKLETHKTIRVLNMRQGSQHDRVDQIEDQGIRSDAQSKGKHRHERKAGRPDQHSKRVANVLAKSLHPNLPGNWPLSR